MDNVISVDTQKDSTTYYKMLFIYRALLNGWKVKMINENSFEFTNSNNSIKKHYISDKFLENFVNSNIY